MFADESWYIERPEPEVRREGVLAPHPHAVGPASRGGRDFVLSGLDGIDLVYAVGVEDRLARLVGRTIVVHGKLVPVDGVVELWIGSIEPRWRANIDGFSLHAAARVEAHDRKRHSLMLTSTSAHVRAHVLRE